MDDEKRFCSKCNWNDCDYGLEPYQRYELLHPRKKPRGSIRRKRKKIRMVYAKDGYEIGKLFYKGIMKGFEQGEKENKE